MQVETLDITCEFDGFGQHFLLNKKPFFLRLYDGDEDCPDGFNTCLIKLNASIFSNLDWAREKEKAEDCLKRGIFLLWELNFSLSDDLFFDDATFLSLEFSVRQFVENILARYASYTLGVAFYRGSVEFSKDFPKMSQEIGPLECRDKVLAHLKSLAAQLPQMCPSFLFLDGAELQDLQSYFSLAHTSFYQPFQIFLKSPLIEKFPYAFPSIGWNHPYSPLGFSSHYLLQQQTNEVRISLALCLPVTKKEWERFIDILPALNIPFRVVVPQKLTYDWEGIDDLIVVADELTPQFFRKLQGFCAAGGRVITYKRSFGLANECIINDVASLQLQENAQLYCLFS